MNCSPSTTSDRTARQHASQTCPLIHQHHFRPEYEHSAIRVKRHAASRGTQKLWSVSADSSLMNVGVGCSGSLTDACSSLADNAPGAAHKACSCRALRTRPTLLRRVYPEHAVPETNNYFALPRVRMYFTRALSWSLLSRVPNAGIFPLPSATTPASCPSDCC